MINCNAGAWSRRGQSTNSWGKDQTGTIVYNFNNQGFRSATDYTTCPDYAFFGNSCIFGIGVPETEILTSHFSNSHNYGLAGNYTNKQSVENLYQFVSSDLYAPNVKIVFGWTDRNEPVDDLIQEINHKVPGVLHISFGQKRKDAINLQPQVDTDVSGTHAGPKTHRMWAKTINLLLNRK